MREVKDRFCMLEFVSAQEALLQIFGCLLSEGMSKNYGVYYIWKKEGLFYTEKPESYHSVDMWREMGYTTYDIIELKNYRRKYYNNTKEEVLTGFMFHGAKFFSKNICYESLRNTFNI